ncbi:AcrB/AcrD/AcrF family protein [Sphingomonas qomolangmaensis]|uniref:AcrB/AcrD/AcrF family protein n=1 Tax=Sphingomonas qomolangmaensis TaxID=2918765 RepID=A0ABY5L7J0_9SPHN|nr:AcrB/AcrD/AcrF family protein [Sphingomonas qomolangmaensis]UUL81769.1 AcrB/AcrD/AcrF family protein [Sphingomonas qomolangmaensis]
MHSGRPLAFDLARDLDRHWLRWTLLAWVAVVAFYIHQRWGGIYWLSLADTDDNMRLAQVRAWMGGQGWYDLRQYRMDPPRGIDIHWSRIVDLPIAALIWIFGWFTTPAWAERLAVGFAPMLPLSITMASVALVARRLVAPLAWPLAIVFLLCCAVTIRMFWPLRIDHHGWQLAALAVTVAGLADPRRARGGAVVGLASAFSLSIGLEMLPYCASAGAVIALRWVWHRDEARRMAAYAATLGGGCALGFAAFASNANYAMRCDALTPVWLSVMVVAGALLLALAAANPANRTLRLVAAVIAGGVIAAGFALLFPQCLGRPEGVSEELARTWLSNVREAKPIYRHPFDTAFPMAVLPVIGLVGAIVASWRARGTERFVGWVAVALFGAFACAMLLWQVRAAPAAQLLAVPGATALGWIIFPWLMTRTSVLVRVLGTVVAFMLVSGLFAGLVVRWVPVDRPDPRAKMISRAGARCTSLPALATLNRVPAATVFTHVDLAPRLIVGSHHSGITGPYHRNGDAILDVHHAFQRTPADFRRIAQAHGARYLLICPNMAETTNYRSRSPGGFYAQIARGEVPGFLERVPLPRNSPYRLWRIR